MTLSKLLVALALLPAASALELCNVPIENALAKTVCTKFHDTQGALDAAGCPVDCIAGAGGVTGTGEGSVYSFDKGSGYCDSTLNAVPALLKGVFWFDADTCWDECVSEFGAGDIDNVEYDCDSEECWCYCQDACTCMKGTGGTSTLFKNGGTTKPIDCEGEDGVADDDLYDISGAYYFCDCTDVASDEATCTSKLDAGSWGQYTCAFLNDIIVGTFAGTGTTCDTDVSEFGFASVSDVINAEWGQYLEPCCQSSTNGCTDLPPAPVSPVTVSVGFTLEASVAANAASKSILRTKTAAAMEVAESLLVGFDVISTYHATRRLTEENSHEARRLAAGYTWAASFVYTIDAATNPAGPSTPAALAASVTTALSAPSFSASIMTALPVVTGVSAPVVVEHAAAAAVAVPEKESKKKESGDMTLIFVGVGVLFVLIIGGAAAFLRFKQKASAEDGASPNPVAEVEVVGKNTPKKPLGTSMDSKV